MRSLTLLLCLLAPPLAAMPRPALLAPAGRVIASIKIESNNVFDTQAPPENKLLYRAANHVHIRTRERIILRELLFEVGDVYDPALIEETERNLRALPFIRRAEADAVVNKEGTVDVVVRTYDSWSLEVVASFKRAGGSTSVKAGVTEHNIVGEGKLGSAVFSRDGLAQSKSFGFQDPQFLHAKHLPFAMSAVQAPGVQNYLLSLNRPFYASIVPWSAGGTVSYNKTSVSTYDGRTLTGTASKSVGEAGINYGVAVATSTERTRRVTFGILEHRADFRGIPGAPPGPVPGPEQMTFLQLGADWEELDFLTVRRIQKFTHDEDYNLGLAVLPLLAWAPFVRTLGSTESQFVPSVTATKGFTWADQLLLLNAGYASKYVNGFNSNRVASAGASYYIRGLKYQTLAFHSGLDLGWHLDPAAPLTLGEANGLRGYGLSAFSGDRRFLFNIEDRIFVWDELFRLLDVGTVVFYDSGYAWPSTSSVKLADLKNSVGLGLRVAPSRSADNTPVRIDVAYALNDNQTRSRWSLSILAGQAFR
jgi:outer membrane protein assembly factor BamA